MKVMTLLASVSCVTYIYLGIYLLRLNHRKWMHRLFSLMCLLVAFWCLATVFIYLAETREELVFWYRLSTFGFVPFFPVALHFHLYLVGIKKTPKWLLLVYLPSIYFIYENLTGFLVFNDFWLQDGIWRFQTAIDTVPFYIYMVYGIIWIGTINALNLIRLITADTNKRKIQAQIILICFLTMSIITFLDVIVLPSFGFRLWPPNPPVFAMIWIFGIWIAVTQYRFMHISPAVAADDLFANISQMALLLDNHLRICRLNQWTEKRLKYQSAAVIGKTMGDLVREKNFERTLEKIQRGEEKELACFLHFRENGQAVALFEANFSGLRDKFQDFTGILVTGKEVANRQSFLVKYKISRREAQIIQLLIDGETRAAIARRLAISERTVKFHLAGVYEKLRITNKIQLFSLLYDYGYMPRGSTAQKVLFPEI